MVSSVLNSDAFKDAFKDALTLSLVNSSPSKVLHLTQDELTLIRNSLLNYRSTMNDFSKENINYPDFKKQSEQADQLLTKIRLK